MERSLEDGKAWMRAHLAARRHPFDVIDPATAGAVIEALGGLEPEAWAAAWLAPATGFAERARSAEAAGDRGTAREAWWQAYLCAFLGRYPSPIHAAKLTAYYRAREYFLRATSLQDPPVERVEAPFPGRDGEGEQVAFYVARPRGVTRPPVVVLWGGIDMWKEESWVKGQVFRDLGAATVHVDAPGVGESPVLAGTDGERAWTPVFDWIDASDLDAGRVVALGMSFGGYWAHKLAHTHAERLAAAVNWGGGVHLTFQPSWQEKSRNAASYLMDLMPTRARIFGGTTFEDYIARCPELSLLDQGVLDRPSCPLLLVNGKDDLQNASADIYLALEHGAPKAARLFPGGHMGEGPVMPTVLDWLSPFLFAPDLAREPAREGAQL